MAGHSPSTSCCVIILLQMPCGLVRAAPGMSGAGGCELVSKPRTPREPWSPSTLVVHIWELTFWPHRAMVFPTSPNLCFHQLTLDQQQLARPGVSLSPRVLGKFSGTETESVHLRFDSTALQGDGLHDVGVALIH